MKELETVNTSNFESEVLQNERPVLVDFYADWCGPCNIQTPILEAVASEYDGKVEFVKVNADSDAELLKQYGIRSIPTLILFDKGVGVDKRVGVSNKKDLRNLVGSLVA